MSTSTEIANRALQKLGDAPILSIDDNTERARALKRAYDPVRKALLRSYKWGFARKRATLAADSDAPAFGKAYQFTMPADCLRVLPTNSVYDQDWEIEGRKILTDTGAPLQVKYIADIEDAGAFDHSFREALAAKLAMETAEKITGSNTKRDLAAREYQAAIIEARRVGAFEQTSEEFPEDDWLLARF